MHKLKVKPQIETLPTIHSFCMELGVDNRFMLAIEEAFVNIVSYSGAGEVILTAQHSPDGALIFTLEDDGEAFDPTAWHPLSPPSGSGLQKGGHGIQLMRSMTHSLHYIRKNAKNILTLIKSAKSNV